VAQRVEFRSKGVTCIGYLYGDVAPQPRPCVVLCPGFGGTQDTPAFTANARDFAAEGFLALTFDYRHLGESDGLPRQLVDIEEQLADIAAAVSYARRLPGVDRDRIALWGTSLGGGHVVVAAARDPQIAAVVAQIPFNGFPGKVKARSTAATLRLLGAMILDAVRGVLHVAPAYIKQVAMPGELAVMTSTEADHTIDGMRSATWRNEVAPRALLAMMRYKPGDHASRVKAPMLVCIGEYDQETQAADASQLAHLAPHGELRTYHHGHFAFYHETVRKEVHADQVAFLTRVLARRT
jgi:pimeloyl-ACP methyl ester carboxylesterase